jgi:2-oxo-4-hydroxy-4-carboxy-5-ureidoimidazoline decarboxylase
MSLTEYRKLDRTGFTREFGALYEHSPWVAAAAFDSFHENGHIESIGELHNCFETSVMNASQQRQLRLLNAHPQLAVAKTNASELTVDSQKEQSGAGLDQCNAAEYEEFKKLNQEYQEKFGFPFIIAVKGLDRKMILDTFKSRVESKQPDEFYSALKQVCKIGRFRLESLLNA